MMVDNQVANAFSNAAIHYKKHDVVQRLSAELLQQFMLNSPQYADGHLLDIGCGPGTNFSPFNRINQVTVVDIAPQMLEQVKLHFPQYQRVCSNVETLALANHCVDNVYSNLALQWCDNFDAAIDQIQRVLIPQGGCHLAIVADGSLPELKTLGFRVNPFMNMPRMLNAFGLTEKTASPHVVPIHTSDKSLVTDCQQQSCEPLINGHFSSQTPSLLRPLHSDNQSTTAWQLLDAKVVKLTVYFDDLKSLLYSIKGVGASVVDDAGTKTKTSPMSKSQWLKRIDLAQGLKTDKGIPLTYHIALIHAQNILCDSESRT